MQAIDAVKPFESRRARQRAAGINLPPLPSRRRVGRSIDGVTPLRPQQMPTPYTSTPTLRHEQYPINKDLHTAAGPKTTGLKITRPQARLKRNVMAAVIAGIAAIGLTILTHLPLGQVIVMLYGVVALVRQIPSRKTFLAALIVLICVPVSIVLFGGQNIISSSLASYSFLLLGIGVMSLGLELRRDNDQVQA